MQPLRITRQNWRQYMTGIRNCYALSWAYVFYTMPELAFYKPEVDNVLRVELCEAEFPGHYLDQGGTSAFYVLLNDGQVCGTLGLHMERRSCQIERFALRPPWHQDEFAAQLYALAEAHASARGCRELWTLDWVKNKPELVWAKSAGLQPVSSCLANIPGMTREYCVCSSKALVVDAKVPHKKRRRV